MSYKPEVKVDGAWYPNSLVFATREEAETAAKDTYSRWMLATDSRAVESNDAVNYRWVAGTGLVAIAEGGR